MFDAQGGVCTWCSLPLPEDLSDVAVDHIIPKCRGGPNRKWNNQLLHRVCNGAGGKGKSLTEQARALAAEHGVTLREPSPAPVQIRSSRWTSWWSPDLRRH
jgi:HNH endonuclease